MTECKFIVGETYKDGWGNSCRILANDAIGEFPVISLELESGGVWRHRIDGSMEDQRDANDALTLPTEKRTMWVNVYPEKNTANDRGYATKGMADAIAYADRQSRIACIEVTYEVPA